MPTTAQRNVTSGNAMEVMRCPSQGVDKKSVSKEGIWSNRSNDVSLERLQKFWGELPRHARQELLRVDKQTFFEAARKNMYCSRCNGLLVERFAQIVRRGKLSQQEGVGLSLHYRTGAFPNESERKLDAVENPSAHSWGGLVATRDGILTLMDSYVYGDSLHSIQNVFDCARAREHERELEFPDACGGGGRGWISHAMTNYGRVHGLRETCALHTSRIFCDTLVDFFSPLGEDSQLNLLQMKEEDFIERLMHRFDSKRFCRDCRKNVIREFKELKELKRLSRETCCTSWFCAADTAFQYEVTGDTVRACWNKSFLDAVEKYHHFEWAIGTGEGKSDILEFEDVGMAGEVQVNGLELDDLDACFITLRAWRLDGHSTELTVKAHALKGRPCVHCWLVVGDGFVRITKGGNIREFFEHAEEAEEEEDDDAVDEDGNDLDREGSRPQKHAKSPELAREFLLDAATVIFKEQVEKAFRESIARQNAHHTFVCLALKLLEERMHVACKEIITLEKQVKLLEEEENERREEEERKQRRRTKEKEKKLRRKERLRGKEKAKEKEREDDESDLFFTSIETSACELSTSIAEEPSATVRYVDLHSDKEDTFARSPPDNIIERNTSKSVSKESQCLEIDSCGDPHYKDRKPNKYEDANNSLILEQSKFSRIKPRCTEDSSSNHSNSRTFLDSETNIQYDESRRRADAYAFPSMQWHNGVNRNLKGNIQRAPFTTSSPKNSDKSHPLKNRMRDGYDWHSCRFNQQGHGAKYAPSNSIVKPGWEVKTFNREQATNASRLLNNGNQHISRWNTTDSPIVLKGKIGTDNSDLSRVVPHAKKVWEPRDSPKKCLRKCSDDMIILQANPSQGNERSTIKKGQEKLQNAQEEPAENRPPVVDDYSIAVAYSSCDDCMEINDNCSTNDFSGCPHEFSEQAILRNYQKNVGEDEVDSCFVSASSPTSNNCDALTSSSSSDNCSSCLSETDSNSNTSGVQNLESSSTSDSEDASQLSEGRDSSRCNSTVVDSCQGRDLDNKKITDDVVPYSNVTSFGYQVAQYSGVNFTNSRPTENVCSSDPSRCGYDTVARQQQMHSNSFGMTPFSAPIYRAHGQAFLPAIPTNGLVPFTYPHSYVYPSPLGYGLPANQPTEIFMPFNVQAVTSTGVNVSQPSAYRPVDKFSVAKLDEQMKTSRVKVNCQDNGSCDPTSIINAVKRQRDLNRDLSCKPPSIPQNGAVKDAGESYKTSFSLFHSGGPVASAYNIDLKTWKGKHVPEEQATTTRLSDEKTVKQYNLFA